MNWSSIWGKFYRKQREEVVETPEPIIQEPSKFDGAYVTKEDDARLTAQQQVIFDFMSDGNWKTLRAIANETNYPETSISAQLRNLRKKKFGNHVVNTRHIKGTGRGNYEYQLIPNVID